MTHGPPLPLLTLALIGPGGVGGALLRQLAAFAPPGWRLGALVGRERMRWGELDWAETAADPRALLQGGDGTDLTRLDALPRPAVIADCSGSEAAVKHFPRWLRAGISVVTPGKHAGAGPGARARAIRTAADEGGSLFCQGAAVGAGLPAITAVRDLRRTGDPPQRIRGVFSGTLGWLLSSFDGSRPFSELLHAAREQGYTEPDPRDDLSGTDVARKLVILAREAGAELELADVEVENPVPENLRAVDLAEFLARVGELDAPLFARLRAAQAGGGRLRAVGELTLGPTPQARAGLQVLPPSDPLCSLRLSENAVLIHSRRYHDIPLCLRGPGAGTEVTAGAVFADLLRAAGVRA